MDIKQSGFCVILLACAAHIGLLFRGLDRLDQLSNVCVTQHTDHRWQDLLLVTLLCWGAFCAGRRYQLSHWLFWRAPNLTVFQEPLLEPSSQDTAASFGSQDSSRRLRKAAEPSA